MEMVERLSRPTATTVRMIISKSVMTKAKPRGGEARVGVFMAWWMGCSWIFASRVDFFARRSGMHKVKSTGGAGVQTKTSGRVQSFLDEAEVAAWTGCLRWGLLTEEIGLKGKNFSPLSRQERQGKIDAFFKSETLASLKP
jgi:hypothetical protein